MKLHYQSTGQGRALVILHGLFGSGDNWKGFAKSLENSARVIMVDIRNHGRSPHSSEQNYQLMADDLAELCQDLNLDSIDLIGHSVGGKMAMAFSESYPQLLNKLMVVDIAPRQYHDRHGKDFNALLAVDLSAYTRRSEVDKVLQFSIPIKTIRQFLLMNLMVDDGKLTWRLNLPALSEHYPELLQAVCQTSHIDIPTCFIRGGLSDYLNDTDEELISQIFSQSQIITIEQANHWVHAEQPQEFIKNVRVFFNYD
mgnify:CR=1 FL=1